MRFVGNDSSLIFIIKISKEELALKSPHILKGQFSILEHSNSLSGVSRHRATFLDSDSLFYYFK